MEGQSRVLLDGIIRDAMQNNYTGGSLDNVMDDTAKALGAHATDLAEHIGRQRDTHNNAYRRLQPRSSVAPAHITFILPQPSFVPRYPLLTQRHHHVVVVVVVVAAAAAAAAVGVVWCVVVQARTLSASRCVPNSARTSTPHALPTRPYGKR